MKRNDKKLKEAFYEKLGDAAGNITAACKAVNIDRGSYYNWLREDAQFKERVGHVIDGLIDNVESALYANCLAGNVAAQIFMLKCRRKDLYNELPPDNTAATLTDAPPEWTPFDGPQTSAYLSPAQEIWYGGAAGGGKTDFGIGMAILKHKRSIIFRRTFPELKYIMERAESITGVNVKQSNKTLQTKDGRILEFGSMQLESDKEKYQGRPHDLKVYDEVTHFTRSQFMYTKAWNRTNDPNQPCQVLCTFNPPTDPDQDWVISYLKPWLDPHHPNPAKSGEIRYYVIDDDGNMQWSESKKPVEINGKKYTPTSCTFIRASVEDNPYFMETGYDQLLESLPEPLRSKLRYGDFSAGRADSEWQLFPTVAVNAALRTGMDCSKHKLIAIGVDVARGGEDKTVFAMLYSNNHITIKSFDGRETPDAQAVLQRLINVYRDDAMILIDAIGVGTSVVDLCKTKYKNVRAVNVAQASKEKDSSGKFGFANLRAEAHWRFREDLIKGVYTLDETKTIASDLLVTRWSVVGYGGIKIESKDEIRKRIGRSPDESDAVLLSTMYRKFAGSQFYLG